MREFDLTDMSDGRNEAMTGLVMAEGKVMDDVTVTYYVPTLTKAQKVDLFGSEESGTKGIQHRQRALAQQRLRVQSEDHGLKFIPV